jgi:hypothetical protein
VSMLNLTSEGVFGPTLPPANKVLLGTVYGYSDTTGTLVSGDGSAQIFEVNDLRIEVHE